MSKCGWVGSLRALCVLGLMAIACGQMEDSPFDANAGGASNQAAGAPSGGAGASQAGAVGSEGGAASSEAGAPSSEGGAPGSVGGCDLDLKTCGVRCVDSRFDPQNCGDCGVVCETGTLCSTGQCAVTCLGGSTQCGKLCVDVENDRANCGDCAHACAAGEVCSAGSCGLSCAGGSERCGDACVDLRDDPNHCGSCDQACNAGGVCVAGKCVDACGSGRINCNGTCVVPSLDLQNCGACGNVCQLGEVCSDGKCGSVCTDSIRCGNACVDPLTDAANCGGCGTVCSAGQFCVNGACGLHCELSGRQECNGVCVDETTDSQNCGFCGGACQSGLTCSNGVCGCYGDHVMCRGVCTDTKTDLGNCGVCGVACGANQACLDSVCTCTPGTERCGADCVVKSISAANCGGCGKACAVGKVCTRSTCADSVGSWSTFQGDIQHTGSNLAETGVPPLTFGWRQTFAYAPHPVVAASGRVFVSRSTYFAEGDTLSALNISDGTSLWSKNFGGLYSIGHPAVFDGAVYLANGKHSGEPNFLWSLDAATGAANWSSQLLAQWEQYWAPIVVDGIAYTNAGYYGGLYGVSITKGDNAFIQDLAQCDEWSPAYFKGALYTFIANSLNKHDPKSGVVLSTTSVNSTWAAYALRTAPVFGPRLAYVVAPPTLYAIDPDKSAVVWSADGGYSGTPAVADGAVYGISAGNLVVRDADTGKLKWTYVAPADTLTFPPVIANGFVYVASNTTSYAVSIATGQQVATADRGGWLTIADHRLLVAAADGSLSAYILAK